MNPFSKPLFIGAAALMISWCAGCSQPANYLSVDNESRQVELIGTDQTHFNLVLDHLVIGKVERVNQRGESDRFVVTSSNHPELAAGLEFRLTKMPIPFDPERHICMDCESASYRSKVLPTNWTKK
jgi:hypothetical protein